MIKIKNIFKHLKLVTKHKWIVFKLCCKAGIPWRGICHDLSKYSPTEFIESIKYYQGNRSPITAAKEEKGYSEAWLHHKGRNKHHSEYWMDLSTKEKTPIMPYKYTVEMLCDKLSAGIVYQGEKWNKEYPIKYWNEHEKEKLMLNPNMKDLITDFFQQVSKKGINEVVNKKKLKDLYKKYCSKS